MTERETIDYINIEILHTSLVIACLNKSERLNDELNKKKNSDIKKYIQKELGRDLEEFKDSCARTTFNVDSGKPILVFIRNDKRDWNFFQTIVHEVNHVVEGFAYYCGFEDEQEFKAYLSGYLFAEIRKMLHSQNKKKQK